MYTVDDLDCQGIEFEYRKHNLNGVSYEVQRALKFTTKDGKYESTHPDSDGYSYWKKVGDDIKLGHTSYDYIFVIEQGKIDAVRVLNKLTKE